MTKVSVVVPVYNAEPYLERCINSILNQSTKKDIVSGGSHPDIELILVDDGSSDRSKDIIKQYLEKEKLEGTNRIKFIEAKHEGVSEARNKGLEIATGKYIMFTDADDELLPHSINKMVSVAEKDKSDIVLDPVMLRIHNEGTKELMNIKESPRKAIYDLTQTEDLKQYNLDIFATIWGTSACSKLFRGDIIRDNKVKFYPIKKVYSEDGFFNIEYSNYVKKASVLENPVYGYYENTSSITHTWEDPKISVKAMNNFLKLIKENCINWDKVSPVHGCFYFTNCMIILQRARNREEVKELIRDTLDHDFMRKAALNDMEHMMTYYGNKSALVWAIDEFKEYQKRYPQYNEDYQRIIDTLSKHIEISKIKKNELAKSCVARMHNNTTKIHNDWKSIVEVFKGLGDIDNFIKHVKKTDILLELIHTKRKKVDQEYRNVCVAIDKKEPLVYKKDNGAYITDYYRHQRIKEAISNIMSIYTCSNLQMEKKIEKIMEVIEQSNSKDIFASFPIPHHNRNSNIKRMRTCDFNQYTKKAIPKDSSQHRLKRSLSCPTLVMG